MAFCTIVQCVVRVIYIFRIEFPVQLCLRELMVCVLRYTYTAKLADMIKILHNYLYAIRY